MTKNQIFEEVVKITTIDASCCKDEHGADPELYRSRITDCMDDDTFLYLMKSYISTFHVRGHLNFFQNSRSFLSFRVQRYNDALYVTNTAPSSNLQVGDKIVQVNGRSVADFAADHQEMLYDEPAERQGACWRILLTFAKTVTIEDTNGDLNTVPILLIDQWDAGAPYFCKQLLDQVAYMRLADFADDAAIVRMYQENDALLRNSEYLVIDVRDNGGGNDSAYMPLLEFCLPEGATSESLADSVFDSDIEINYSARNCDIRIAQFESSLEQDLPIDTRNMLGSMLNQMRAHYGKGFMKLGSLDSDHAPYVGAALPKKVYILTDEDCASSGDSFVDTMRRSPKVTVVGRPTMGILDFSNCAYVPFGDFMLFYPTSRSLYLDQGIQMRGRGIPVDVLVPWTPEHLRRDVMLDTVLALIKEDSTT